MLGVHAPNCILRPISAARVKSWAFGPAPLGTGWSYHERKSSAATQKQTNDPTQDLFNACGRDSKRELPPKRGGAVAFFRSDLWFSARFPYSGTQADMSDVYDRGQAIPKAEIERPYRAHLLSPELACEDKANRSDLNECLGKAKDAAKRSKSAPVQPQENSLFMRDGKGMPDGAHRTDSNPGRSIGAACCATAEIPDSTHFAHDALSAVLLFGGVYDDGCMSQDIWRWDARMRLWGWRSQLTGTFHQTAMSDPLCSRPEELSQRYNANSVLNRIIHAKVRLPPSTCFSLLITPRS